MIGRIWLFVLLSQVSLSSYSNTFLIPQKVPNRIKNIIYYIAEDFPEKIPLFVYDGRRKGLEVSYGKKKSKLGEVVYPI